MGEETACFPSRFAEEEEVEDERLRAVLMRDIPPKDTLFVAPQWSNFSGILPHQTETGVKSPMSLGIIGGRPMLPLREQNQEEDCQKHAPNRAQGLCPAQPDDMPHPHRRHVRSAASAA